MILQQSNIWYIMRCDVSADNSMTMEVGAEAQQGADTAVAETEAQQITQAQIATLTQVTMSTRSLFTNPCDHFRLVILQLSQDQSYDSSCLWHWM